MTAADDFWKSTHHRHATEIEQGEHDDQCEWRVGFYLCNCAKRARIATGLTELPGPLEYQHPLCPNCYQEVTHNGDAFECPRCHCVWDSDAGYWQGASGWTDDYGDDLAELAAKHDAERSHI